MTFISNPPQSYKKNSTYASPLTKKHKFSPFPHPPPVRPNTRHTLNPPARILSQRPPNALLALSSPRPYSDHLDINTAKRRKQDENKTKTSSDDYAGISQLHAAFAPRLHQPETALPARPFNTLSTPKPIKK